MSQPDHAHWLVVTSPEIFFALVDRHVTGPMAAAGYVKIGEYDDVSRKARAVPLVAARSQWLAKKQWSWSPRLVSLFICRTKGPRERVLQVGFEGLDEDGESDEKWLDYLPEAGELDLAFWSDVLDGHADWEVWNESAVPNTDELERRLAVVGAAMRGRASE